MSCDEALKQSWQECGEGQAYIRIDASTRIEREKERERALVEHRGRKECTLFTLHDAHYLFFSIQVKRGTFFFFLKRKMRL